MSDYTDKEELEFIESLYDEADKQIKEVYQEQKDNRDELLKQIAAIMLVYTILNDFMKLSKTDKKKEYNRLSKIITGGAQSQGATQNKVIEKMLSSTINKTFDFYSYNVNLKDVREIIGTNFKGAHFSDRVWGHNNDVAKLLHKQTQDFLNGKINVNQIKRNIEKTYNTSAYNVQRLVETEISHVESLAFKRFCKGTGVEQVLRNEKIDSRTCSICAGVNGKVYNLDDAPDNLHPRCRGYNTVL